MRGVLGEVFETEENGMSREVLSVPDTQKLVTDGMVSAEQDDDMDDGEDEPF